MTATPHILIVDDDRQIRTSLGRFLTANGVRATHATHATHATDAAAMFAALEKGRFDLIVLDVMMPGKDGLSACRRLRGTSKIPVVLLTAMSDETDRIVGLELGADDYVCKPFSPRELLARIRAVLRRVGSEPEERPPRHPWSSSGGSSIGSGERYRTRKGLSSNSRPANMTCS